MVSIFWAILENLYANSAKLKDNLDHMDNNLLEVSQLKDQVSHLDGEMKKLRSELKDTWNKGLGIIAKFTDWDLMEKIKSSFIKCISFLYVSQLYSLALM